MICQDWSGAVSSTVARGESRHHLHRLRAALDQGPDDLARRMDSHRGARVPALRRRNRAPPPPRCRRAARPPWQCPRAPRDRSTAATLQMRLPGGSMDAAQPTIDSGLQNVQRHCALIEQFRVERPHIEAGPQRLLRPCPQTAVSFVRPGRTPAPRRATTRSRSTVGARGRLVDRQLGLQVIDRLLASPALRVQAGVDHQSGRAAHLDRAGRRTSIPDRGKAPISSPSEAAYKLQPSTKAGSPPNLRNARQVGALLLDRELVLVSGHRLLEKQSRRRDRPRRRSGGVHVHEWRRSFRWACRADRTMPGRSPAGTPRRRGSRNRPAAPGKTARASRRRPAP